MHIPVLQKEVIQYLNPKLNENFIDCTIGEGGHTLAILEKNTPNGKVLGIDWDPEIIKSLDLRFKNYDLRKRLILVCDNFANLKEIVKKYNFKSIQGILFDLGMSSWHLEESRRGFSFLRNEPLDMRYHITNFRRPSEIGYGLTAEKILNEWPEEAIEKILKDYGEERFSKKIAREIVNSRQIKPIKTTFQLVEIIKRVVPGWYRHRKIHFATRTFQALRIVVNNELNNLEKGLRQALEILEPGGRLVIISFHSLEDKIVKNFLSAYAKGYGGQENQAKEGLPAEALAKVGLPKLKILTKKPISPGKEEIKINPRSRSAKLRAAMKTINN